MRRTRRAPQCSTSLSIFRHGCSLSLTYPVIAFIAISRIYVETIKTRISLRAICWYRFLAPVDDMIWFDFKHFVCFFFTLVIFIWVHVDVVVTFIESTVSFLAIFVIHVMVRVVFGRVLEEIYLNIEKTSQKQGRRMTKPDGARAAQPIDSLFYCSENQRRLKPHCGCAFRNTTKEFTIA